MEKNTFSRGFTLIELLVVIAIIGILSSVVLASLNTARAGAADAAVKSNLGSIRAQAELYYDNNSQAYATASLAAGTCPAYNASPATNMFSLDQQIAAATAAAGSAGGGTATCATNGQAYAVSAPLKKAVGKHWCIDSTGVARQTAGAVASGTFVCPVAG